jgi:hypothetical protein
MRAVVLDPRKAYPNPSPFNCNNCAFRNPCMAMEDGSDWKHIVDTQYNVVEEKRW